MHRFSGRLLRVAATLALATSSVSAPVGASAQSAGFSCQRNAAYCTEVFDSLNYDGVYTGHDEPSLLFYSDTAGSGNSNLYRLTLPKDPPTQPNQSGTAGTYNFQIHPAFWFGMAMCDDQSAPNPGGSALAGAQVPCTPDSDANIHTGTTPGAADYIGKTPGSAFMEMQFYPPGWVSWPAGLSCDATRWCAALNIDSLSENMNTGQLNNDACLKAAGVEYVNFAFITRSGVAHAPAAPLLATLDTFTPHPNDDLFMNSGDTLAVDLHDTADGFQVVIQDVTTGQTGSMTASVANQFGEVQFDPKGKTCAGHNIPSAFHPMYASSSENTRVVWTAHSYNVAFSDEIGHFEYCDAVDPTTGSCTTGSATDPSSPDRDDVDCFAASESTRIRISGCLGFSAADSDFDGAAYQRTWPGSLSNPGANQVLNPTSILFSSPRFNGTQSYSRVAFETDLPRIEVAPTNPPCNRTTGVNCVNPPPGANFYPLYSTRNDTVSGCLWQLGGANIPGTKNTFGGTSTAEFGGLLTLNYPATTGVIQRKNDFRQVLSNPCHGI